MKKIVTSESVNLGHPDKTCDVIADAFLDAALAWDPHAQMAVECAIKDDRLFIYGEATTTAQIDYESIAREILREIGYENEFRIETQISAQSPDINAAVVRDSELCANDQGMMFGYATNETPEFMPAPIVIAHKLMRQYEDFRRSGRGCGNYFADAKSQVSVEYDANDRPKKIVTVLVSVSHAAALTHERIRAEIIEYVVNPVLAEYKSLVGKNTEILVNPSGKFTIWGSFSDSGCVGRKIVVDTYGGAAPNGGGCFSSKNATKVDRSGAYYARFVAKNIVAANLADRCQVSVSYAIGIAKPVSVFIECFCTNRVPMTEIESFVRRNFDFRVGNIVTELGLTRPIFRQTAAFGHFGRPEFPWEQIKPIKPKPLS
jgi:S-adenosylmethionine synthetase